MSSEVTSGRRNEEEVRLGNQSNNEIINDRHDMGSRLLLETGLVFMQSNITRDNANNFQFSSMSEASAIIGMGRQVLQVNW